MPRYLSAFLPLFWRSDVVRSRPALILRVVNLAALTHRMGPGGVAALLGQMAGRIADDLRLRGPMHPSDCGDLCWRLPPRSERGVADAVQRLQAILRAGFDLPDGGTAPVVAAVMVRPAGGIDGDHDLFARGCRFLDRRPAVDRVRVAIMDADMMPAPDADRMPGIHDHAFDPDWVEAAFQPQMCCDTGAISGFRAVARLWHPYRGPQDAREFVPFLDADQARALTQSMLRHAIGALSCWDSAGHVVPQVSLIVTAADLARPDFADSILWELDRQNIAPPRLALEIAGDLANDPVARAVLVRLTACGCRLDLCDFGSGGASMDTLRGLSPTRAIISSGFTADCDNDPIAQQMILAVLSLAGHLDLPTLAGRVDTAAEHGFLAQIGCAHVQGPAIAPAMPLADTLAYLAAHRASRVELPGILRRA